MSAQDIGYLTTDHPQAMGIDLGTTFCAVSCLMNDSVLECYPIDGTETLLPSALYFDSKIEYGRKALELGLDNPDDVVDAFKRDMGQAHFHRKVRHHWTPPEVLSALLLDEIRNRMQRHLPGVSRAVITVPAYFDERRRKATFEAGRLAGLEVVDIVNEPVAAALAELHHQGLLDKAQENQSRIMVYDLGGGTFDVSVLEVIGHEITTLASDGDIRLGGLDFDERVVDYIAEQFMEQHGVDPRSDFGYAQRLWTLAEKAKRDLSTESSTTVVCAFAGMRLGVEITRSTFEQLIASFIERTVVTSLDALQQAGLTWSQLDQILLVGGSSRIPAVADRLWQVSGKKPTVSHAPDLAVAMGAAVFAGLANSKKLAPLKVVNVNAHSLGIAGVDVRTGQPINRIIIPRNSRLPAIKRQKFVTKKVNQRTIEIKIVEGENENPKYCVPVGKCIATLSPDLPERTEVVVTVRVAENGTLSVACVVPMTKEGAHVEIRREGLLDLEPLPVWRDRLLHGVVRTPQETPDLPAVPAVPSPDLLDHSQVVKRIDYLCQEVGERHATATVPPDVLPAQRYLQSTRREYAAICHLLGEVRSALAKSHDSLERSKLQSSAAALRTYSKESEKLLIYARIALGAACVRADCLTEAAAEQGQEIRQLQEAVNSWSQEASQAG